MGSEVGRILEGQVNFPLVAKYADPRDRELVERTLKTYRQTALAVERTDGLRGLKLLDIGAVGKWVEDVRIPVDVASGPSCAS